MRVLHLAWEYPPRLYGGLGRHVHGLSVALAGRGTEVVVATPELRRHRELPPTPGIRVLRAPLPAVDLPDDRWLAATLDANVRLAETVLAAHPDVDVLQVHDWMVGHAARLLAPVLAVPVVATIHATERGRHQGHLPPGYSEWIDGQERLLVDLADRVVVCAAHMGAHVIEWLDADPDRVRVIPNGVDLAAWQDEPGQVHGPLPRVVFAGRLEFEKGVHVLLQATSGMRCAVVIAGEGSYAGELHALAGRDVTFVGHLDQPALASLLRSADVVVVPSLYEPFGLSALEAMAAGAAVIASDTGGLAEVVTDGAGMLVTPDDVAALRTAIRTVITDRTVAADLRRAGPRRAAQLSWTAAAAAHQQVYADLLGG